MLIRNSTEGSRALGLRCRKSRLIFGNITNRMLNKSFLLPAFLVASALAVALTILLTLQSPDDQPSPAVGDKRDSGGSVKSVSPIEAEASSFGSPDSFDTASRLSGVVSASPPAETEAPAAAESPLQPWEQAINQILESDEANLQAAARLNALLPTLPLEGQVEAAQHMVNLTDDENYQSASALILNPATPAEVADVIFADALNRPNSVKLPLMIAVLRVPGHRLRQETLSAMQVFAGQDLGDNPEAWNAFVQNFLAKEAQDEAAAAVQQ